MKKILALLTSFLISGAVAPATLQTTTNNNLRNYSAITKSITKNINFSFYQLGTMSSGHTWDHKVITLLYYKQYANSWSDFTNKYSTLKLLNFDGKSGGQGSTVTKNSYEIKTKDIQFGKETTILRYDYHLIVCVQWGVIDFTFIDKNGMLLIDANFYTRSSNAIYHVWVSLNISDAIFS